MSLAPIIIFAFNRPEAFRACINALSKCPEAKESQLFVFVDGARNSTEEQTISKVRDFVAKIEGFKSVTHAFSQQNRGLGPSIISGVTEVINHYEQAIVIEDDLIVQPNFLGFMNQGLQKYRNESKVFSICGYTNRISIPKDYPYDAYFCTRSSSWGWATWADRWNTVDWELKNWEELTHYKKPFNDWGGSDCFGMLKSWHDGKIKSWAIRFCFAQFLQDKLSLFPTKSLLKNDGFDGAGTNCHKYSRFKYDLMDAEKSRFKFPNNIKTDRTLYRRAMAYNSIWIRIWSRLMYIVIDKT